jgi:hypothetical protein
LRTTEKHEAFVEVGIGIGIGIDQKSLFPGIIKPQRPFDPDSDTDPDTDNHVITKTCVNFFHHVSPLDAN